MAKQDNDNDVLVLAYYADADAAEAAAKNLKEWDKEDDGVKLGAIGVVTLDEKTGHLRVDEIGQRNAKTGALWGTAIGAGLGLITGGIGVIPGMLLGAAIGGGAGSLDHKSLGMSDSDAATLTKNLQEGGAALGIMCDDFEVEPTRARMILEGGTVAYFSVPDEMAVAITAAAVAQSDASASVDDAVNEVYQSGVNAVGMQTADAETADAIGAIAAISCLSADDAAKLYEAGVDKASTLLQMGASPEGRAEMSAATGLDEVTILVAVKEMDLMRIDGVGVVYAQLLHAAGVETVPDLARRNPAKLTAKLTEVNETAAIAEVLPTEETVTDWVNQAKDLPKMISY